MEETKNLKVGDKVRMVNCGEADHYKDRIWVCRTDSFISKYGHEPKPELVFLEDFSGSFYCPYLEKVVE
jgi:hypothetical protein